jgi:predicted dehydrogenase
MKTFNIAVVGAGYWGKKIIGEYLRLSRDNPNIELSMVCDLADKNLDYCKKVLGIPKKNLTRSYQNVLCSSKIDAIHICTPNETHHKICKEAILAGKHTLLEKPMALQARDAWELVVTAEQRGLILQVGHIFRFNNALKRMRDLVAREYFGTLYYLKLQWTTFMSSPMNRDIVFDLGPHPVDIVNYLLNKWPVRVTCKAEAYRNRSLYELAYATMEFDGKLMAHMELSWLQPGRVRQATMVGSKRAATVDCVNQTIGIYKDGDGNLSSLSVTPNNTMLDEISHFVKSVANGHNGRNSGVIGAKNVDVLERLSKSVEENKTVDMGQALELRE